MIEEGIGIDQDHQLQNVESCNLRHCTALHDNVFHVYVYIYVYTNGYNIGLISSWKSSSCLILEEEVV